MIWLIVCATVIIAVLCLAFRVACRALDMLEGRR